MRIGLTIITFLLGICCVVYGQQPSYRIVGEEFFNNKDIYTIVDDLEQNIWIGTDVGLVRYDGNEFVTYTNSALKSNAVFGLALDNYGNVFCYNLNGQILTIKDDSLQLYYQIPDSLNKGTHVINFDNQDNLIISAGRTFFRVDAEQKVTIIYDKKIEYGLSVLGNEMLRMEDGTLIFMLLDERLIGEWLNGELTVKSCIHRDSIWTPLNQEDVLLIGKGADEFFLYHRLENHTWVYSNLEYADCIDWLYHVSLGNKVWYACRENGVYVYDREGKLLYDNKLYDKYVISTLARDKEGNMWLGTFDEGLLFVPHIDVIDFTKHPIFKDEKATAITLGDDESVYVANRSGMVYQIDSNLKVEPIFQSPQKKIHCLHWFSEQQELHFDGGLFDVGNNSFRRKNLVGIKKMQKINAHSYLATTMNGVYFYNLGLKDEENLKERFFYDPTNGCDSSRYSSTNTLIHSSICLGRSSGILYDTISKAFWIGKASDLLYGKTFPFKVIKYNGNSIIASSICRYEDETYIATDKGILVFEDTVFKQRILMENGLLSDNVKEIILEGDLLYVVSDKGLQYLNLKTKVTHTFVDADGLLSNRIERVALGKQHIWLLTSKGLQRVRKAVLNRKSRIPRIKFTTISVNEMPINVLNKHDFAFNENKITFQFIGNSYRSQNALIYEYRLRGTNDDWTISDQNIVRYNALGAGNYTFEVRAIDQKGNTSLTVSYDFCIAIPYWQEWWFVVLCTFGVALIVALFFLIRIQLLKKQNKLLLEKQEIERKLMESQQTALRSQMNPHFMFNALNSIQELIMINEKQMAGHYLGKFADLMRIYLNQSQKSVITLNEELTALELYLDLEKVRFEDTLTIHLEVSDKIEKDFVTLPPMLLQPYIENAFKHGLLHKEKDRILWIKFNYKEGEKAICCIIEDNGVGRERSAAINQFRSRHHQSFSVSATQKRLDLLNYSRQHLIIVAIEDLKDATNQATGTRVILEIPLDWNVLT